MRLAIIVLIWLSSYYSQPCLIPKDTPVEVWLTEGVWERKYEINEWDCSNMTAYTEWVLENCGYSATIIIGYYHSWLEIDLPSADLFWYETVYRYPTPVQPDLEGIWRFDSIHDLWEQLVNDYGYEAFTIFAREFMFNPFERVVPKEVENDSGGDRWEKVP